MIYYGLINDVVKKKMEDLFSDYFDDIIVQQKESWGFVKLINKDGLIVTALFNYEDGDIKDINNIDIKKLSDKINVYGYKIIECSLRENATILRCREEDALLKLLTGLKKVQYIRKKIK